MNYLLKKLKIYNDKRGKLIELITKSDLVKDFNFGNLFIVTFDNKNIVRGNHYHEKQDEYYIVLEGKIEVRLIDIKTGEKKTIKLSSDNPQYLRIGPLIAHFSSSLSEKATLLGYNSKSYDLKSPDTKPYSE